MKSQELKVRFSLLYGYNAVSLLDTTKNSLIDGGIICYMLNIFAW